MADETVVVRTGTQSSGQGHETAFAMLVAERLEIPVEKVRVVQGDTEAIAAGGGTGGSSSLPIGATTIRRATDQMLEKATSLAADALEAAVADVEYGGGEFTVAGTDVRMGLFELASRVEPEIGSGAAWAKRASKVTISPARTVPTYAKSRLTRKPGPSASCATRRWTTWEGCCTRSLPKHRSTAASPRPSVRR
jgi:CO/xanthine dehydrogenase Mo-binding subunit